MPRSCCPAPQRITPVPANGQKLDAVYEGREMLRWGWWWKCVRDLQGLGLEGLSGFPGDRHLCPDTGKLVFTADGRGVDRRLGSEMLAYH